MKVSIVDIFKRLVKYDKKLAIYLNGEDNAYPERTDRLLNNSVTAKTASQIMTQYLLGRGFGEADNFHVSKGVKLIDFAEDIAKDIVENRGCFIHVNYDMNFDISTMKVLPFSWCRVGEKDDKEYNGKILIKKDWNDSKKKPEVIDVYNSNKAVIQSQIKKAGSIEKYKGQIYYYNAERRYYYPLSRIDAVMNDCDSEAQSAVYKNQLLRKGFFGRTVVVTRSLIDENISEFIYDDGKRTLNPEYQRAESEANSFKSTVEEFLGAENAGGAMVIQTDFAGENLDDAILFKNIESNIDPNLFENVENSVRDNILVAFNNLPNGLIKASESLFSNSGEALLEMKKTYWENTTKQRQTLVMIVNDLLKHFSGYNNGTLTINPLIGNVENTSTANAEPEISEETKKAQANLRGSVGGVQGILGIQQSYSDGLTDFESAITILMEIYGFTRSVSSSLLGKPEEDDNNQTNNEGGDTTV